MSCTTPRSNRDILDSLHMARLALSMGEEEIAWFYLQGAAKHWEHRKQLRAEKRYKGWIENNDLLPPPEDAPRDDDEEECE